MSVIVEMRANIPKNGAIGATPEMPDEVGSGRKKVPAMSPKADCHARLLSKEDVLEMGIVRNLFEDVR